MSDDLSQFSMMELFRLEAETQLAIFNETLLALESGTADPSILERLMRAAHSLKGAARIVNLDALVHLAHEMENCFVAAQEGKIHLASEHIDCFLQSSDLLARLSKMSEAEAAAWPAEHTQDFEKLISQLRAIRTNSPPPSNAPIAVPPAPQPAPAAPSTSAPVPPPESTAPPPSAAPPALESSDRLVRVGADSLKRLMELAAESLVETRQLKPLADRLLKLHQKYRELEAALCRLPEELPPLSSHHNLFPHLQTIQSKTAAARQLLSDQLADFDQFLRRSTALSDRLYHEVVASRMRPFADGTAAFPRMVRDLTRKLGKKTRFTISGKATAVDREILEKLEAPLNHLLRNAVDHGLELPAERQALAKPEEGHIKLEARHAAGMLHVNVADDGRGIDPEILRRKIVEKGLVAAATAQNLSEAELFEFLFLPGFTTAQQVTEVSGRGVGLDVVQSMVQEVGGTVRVTSQPGHGATFHLHLPITRSVLRAFLVLIAGEPYALPLPRIDRALKIPAADLLTLEGRLYLSFNGQNIGLVPAHQVLELEPAPSSDALLHLLVLSDHTSQYAIEVDQFLGERDLVVRPLDPRLGKVPDVSSSSLMEDGTPVLVLDVDDLVRSIDSLLRGGRLAKTRRPSAASTLTPKKRILVADDSITVRELQRQLLQARGYEVDTAVDGMEAWNALRLAPYDLIVSDVDMPRMTGIELTKRIKSTERLQQLPVVIVSYKDREEDRLRGMEAGANYYLTKSSFQDETFLQAIADLIGHP